MEADGCAAADDTPGPLTPAAVAATLVAGAAIFLSTGLLCAGAATGGFGSAGRLGATDTLAGLAAAGAEAMNFAWVAALTAAGIAGLLAGAACRFAGWGFGCFYLFRASMRSPPLWYRFPRSVSCVFLV